MDELGISLDEIKHISLEHFVNDTKNKDVATIRHQHYEHKR